ncbi:SDR family NAD(P)-dependent oxidoreductase [Chelatococcus reniformis]|uniref:Short-chain dehydrogenase n=1 Tax=Chelatococcus reniformis TaxID=1494448 RepID=A0A916TWU6_9HYPH|nr:SDR family NAD(P)-dependent oxidoreductase [Chelatococcus reniformis]GGC48437.1 hypothetical protein GCM10010994_04550 [Chelatococcus reniformis]
MRELTGKVAVITGAGSGIGRGLAQAFAAAGMRLVLADIDGASAEETCALLQLPPSRAIPAQVDVAQLTDVERLADVAYGQFGAVDVLCNNAGVVPWQRAGDADRLVWEWVVAVNIWGVINGIETFLPRMRAQGTPGHIVNTASIAGVLPSRVSSLYSTTKFAVVGLSETLREELKETGIGVSVLCPGAVRTRIRETSGQNHPAGMDAAAAVPNRTGLGAAAGALEPEKVAAMVLDAIRDNRLYIFTEPALRPLVDERWRLMMEGFDVLSERKV